MLKHKLSLLGFAAAAALALTGCTAASTGNEGATGSDDAKVHIEVITHGTAGDSFWDVVKSGALKAGSQVDAVVNYQGDGDPTQQSQLIDAAIAKKPDGIVISMANPDGTRAAVKRAVDAGIPVIITNRGENDWKALGANTYVGQSELLAGEAAGERLAKEGVKNVICVVHEVGNIGNQDRCQGVENKLGGKVETLQVDIANVSDAKNTIQSALLADSSIDGVFTLNPAITIAASQAIDEAKSAATLSGFELSADVLKLIEGGKMVFSIDQQPYLQGYLPVIFLADQVRNGDVAGGGQPVYTGPGFVTKDNAAAIAVFAKNGTR